MDNIIEFRDLSIAVDVPHSTCIVCDQPFTKDNVSTPEGWAETKISGMCENCFDELFEGDDDGDS